MPDDYGNTIDPTGGQSPQTDHSQPNEGGNADSGHGSQRHDDGDQTNRDGHPARGDGQQDSGGQTFTQADVDRIAGQRAREAERRAERRVMRLLGNNAQTQQSARPNDAARERDGGQAERAKTRADFQTDEAWIDYRVQRGLEAERQARKQESESAAERRARETVEAAYRDGESIPGFDRDAYDELDLTPAIVHAVLETDTKLRGRLMHHLQQHPDEVSRIARMSPVNQAKAIGKLEDRIAANAGDKGTNDSNADRHSPSRAPRPGTPVGGGNQGQRTGDLSRSSMADYVRQRTRQGARWSGQ